MEPLFSLRQLIQSVGQFVLVVISNIMVYKTFSEVTFDNLFQPIMQGLVVALGILGFTRVGPAPSNVTVIETKAPPTPLPPTVTVTSTPTPTPKP